MTIVGAAHVDRMRRTEPIMQILEDRSASDALYVGMTPDFNELTSAPKWLIKRVTFDGSTLVTEYAELGKWKAIWDDRATYFGPTGGVPLPGDTVSITGSVAIGPANLGRISIVPIVATGWTPLPPLNLSGRQVIGVQNVSGEEIKLNYDNAVGYVGIIVGNGNERYIQLSDLEVVYARSQTGPVNITVEELA